MTQRILFYIIFNKHKLNFEIKKNHWSLALRTFKNTNERILDTNIMIKRMPIDTHKSTSRFSYFTRDYLFLT